MLIGKHVSVVWFKYGTSSTKMICGTDIAISVSRNTALLTMNFGGHVLEPESSID